jgi:hypothetical protein
VKSIEENPAANCGWGLLGRGTLVAILLALVGCANVAPTQRGTLAKPEMQWGFDRAADAISGHTYASKEAASGGRAVGGGGCGCT